FSRGDFRRHMLHGHAVLCARRVRPLRRAPRPPGERDEHVLPLDVRQPLEPGLADRVGQHRVGSRPVWTFVPPPPTQPAAPPVLVAEIAAPIRPGYRASTATPGGCASSRPSSTATS